LSKTVHLRPLKPTGFIRVKTPERAARIHERNAIDEPTHEYKPILKTSFDPEIYKFQKAKLAKVPNPQEHKNPYLASSNKTSEGESKHDAPVHVAEYFIHKKKKYNEQLQRLSNVPTSKIIEEGAFKSLRATSQGFIVESVPERGEEADKRNMYRKNFFISKPFTELNKDFKFQPLVRKAQTSSEDTPYWFQSTAKFYTQDNLEETKRMRNTLNNLPKSDIFGNKLINRPKLDDPFTVQPPSKGQRYELNKMVILEKRTDSNTDKYSSTLKLRWNEDLNKQSYDKSKLTLKVSTSEPFIKRIKEKAYNESDAVFKKVGENENASRIKKEKSMDLKIGHANDYYTYTKKGREDGFHGNRKEILGENYQKSDFFVC